MLREWVCSGEGEGVSYTSSLENQVLSFTGETLYKNTVDTQYYIRFRCTA